MTHCFNEIVLDLLYNLNMALRALRDIFAKRTRVPLYFQFCTTTKRDANNPNDLFECKTDIFEVDCTVSEQYKLSSVITENEIEDGSVNITDHIHEKPQMISITGIITDVPFQILPAVARVPVQAFLSSTSGRLLSPILGSYTKRLSVITTGLITSEFFSGDKKGLNAKAWERLKINFKQKRIFSIVSEVDKIDYAFFESITWDRNYKDGDALRFSADIKELRFVSSDVVESSKRNSNIQPTQSAGDKVPVAINLNSDLGRKLENINTSFLDNGNIFELKNNINIPSNRAMSNLNSLFA